MKKHLVIRYNGLVIDHLHLDEGEYELGRSEECSINVAHSSIHRKHGKLTGSDGVWTYYDYDTQDTTIVSDTGYIGLTDNIDLATAAYVRQEKTGELDAVLVKFRQQRKKKRLVAGVTALALMALTVGAYLFVKWNEKPESPQTLLQAVRDKIVEFEKDKDFSSIEDYKKIGGFKDSDFKDSHGYCTGFLVAPNVVLTALHCFVGGDFLRVTTHFKVRTHDGKKHTPNRIMGFDSKRDFVFLEMKGLESYGHLDWAPEYNVGQTVYTIGNAHGQGVAIREGIMASETPDINDPTITHIRYSAGASPGNSGGPLLDTKGRIVALVFAATGAENYNLGTPVTALKKGFADFVTNKKKKQVRVELKKILNFNAHQFVRGQLLPYLPHYDEHPELLQRILAITLEFNVPMNFRKSASIMLSETLKKSQAAMRDIEKILVKKRELTLGWKSFLSKETPVILFSQFDTSQNSFVKVNGRYYMKVAGFIDSPGKKEFNKYLEQLRKENKFDFQAFGMNTEVNLPAGKNALFYKHNVPEKEKMSLEDLSQGIIYSQTKVSLNGKSGSISFKEFIRHLIGTNGLLAGVHSPFIRPQSYKNFVIKSLDKKPQLSTVTDGAGREWRRYSVKLFEVVHLFVYCLELPEGSTCAARVFPVDEPVRLNLLEEQFRQRLMAHFIENPSFWEPSQLADFYKSKKVKGLRSFSGASWDATEEGFALDLKAFGLQLHLPKGIQSVRLQTGLFLNPEKKSNWVGFGAEWIKGGKLCGAGVEPVGSQSSFFLNAARDAEKTKKLKGKGEKVEIPKAWRKRLSTAKGGDVTLYSYCAPLRDNPVEIGYHFVDFKKAKANKVKYNTL